jgi:hypothetical protein
MQMLRCKHDKAYPYLFGRMANVAVGEKEERSFIKRKKKEERMMTTGWHTVYDIFCVACVGISAARVGSIDRSSQRRFPSVPHKPFQGTGIFQQDERAGVAGSASGAGTGLGGRRGEEVVVEKNNIQVTSPDELKGKYKCAIGNFGVPQYRDGGAGRTRERRRAGGGATDWLFERCKIWGGEGNDDGVVWDP